MSVLMGSGGEVFVCDHLRFSVLFGDTRKNICGRRVWSEQ